MPTPSPWAREQLTTLDAGFERLQRVIEQLGPDGLQRQINGGWTVKEMLAHLACCD